MTELKWFKSSYSDSGGGDCVEVATAPATVHVRDSKTPDHPGRARLSVSGTAWAVFLTHVTR